MWYIYATDYHPDITKNEIVTFAATWIDVEIILLKEAKDKHHMILLILGVTNISPQPVRNPSTQQEVSEGRAGKTSSAAPQSLPSLTLPFEPSLPPLCMEKLSAMKLVPGAKNTGGHWLICGILKKKKMKLFTKQKKMPHRYRKQIYGYQRRKGNGGRDKLGSWD